MRSFGGENGPSTIYVDSPMETDRSPHTEPRSRLQRNRWRFYFPWVKTAVSAPTYDSSILISNRTDQAWLLWHNYHNLGMIGARDDRRVRLVKAGTLSARPRLPGPDGEYLIMSLNGNLQAAEIVEVAPDTRLFALRPLTADGFIFSDLPGTTSVRELGLAPATCNALRRIGVTTVAQLREADLAALWEVRDGGAAYAEIVSFLFQHSQED